MLGYPKPTHRFAASDCAYEVPLIADLEGVAKVQPGCEVRVATATDTDALVDFLETP